MDSHSINLYLRYFLQLTGIAGVAWWGYRLDTSSVKYFFLAGLPLFLITVWRTFNIREDPYRRGEAPVRIRGGMRLAMEAAIFLFTSYAIYQSVNRYLGYVYLVLVILHGLLSRERILWMMKK